MLPLQFSYISKALNHNNSLLQPFVENHLPFLYWTKCTCSSVADAEHAQTLHPAFLSATTAAVIKEGWDFCPKIQSVKPRKCLIMIKLSG